MHATNSIGHGHHSALIADVSCGTEAFNATLDELGNFCGIQLHEISPVFAFSLTGGVPLRLTGM
jgi:hypothetical protein